MMPDVFECKISTTPTHTFKLGDPILLKFEIKNISKKDAYQILKWGTPLEKEVTDFLVLKRGDDVIEYDDPFIERADPPPASSYETIQPEQTLSETVDISTSYPIDQPGQYTATLKAKLFDAYKIDGTAQQAPQERQYHQPHELNKPSVTFRVIRGKVWEDDKLAARMTRLVFVPGVASILNVLVYVLITRFVSNPWWVGPSALFLSLVVTGILSWIFFLPWCRQFVYINRVNSKVYGQLCERSDQLQALIEAFEPKGEKNCSKDAAYKEACRHIRKLKLSIERGLPERSAQAKDVDLQWVLATGYNNLFRRIHLAEEALILFEPRDKAIADSNYNEYRLRDSSIENREKLLGRLTEARKTLEASAEDDEKAMVARQRVREIRHTINVFRIERRAALVTARNRMLKAGMLTTLFGYLAISLAILLNAPVNAIAGVAFVFLIGAITGLFNRLLAEGGDRLAKSARKMEVEIEDYGLVGARLFFTPLFSGIAAIGGIVLSVLITVLTNALHHELSKEVGIETPPSPAYHQTGLVTIFGELENKPVILLIAAVFGLTPSLLINRLKRETDTYISDIETT